MEIEVRARRAEGNRAGAGFQAAHHQFVRGAISVSGWAVIERQRRIQPDSERIQYNPSCVVRISLRGIKGDREMSGDRADWHGIAKSRGEAGAAEGDEICD